MATRKTNSRTSAKSSSRTRRSTAKSRSNDHCCGPTCMNFDATQLIVLFIAALIGMSAVLMIAVMTINGQRNALAAQGEHINFLTRLTSR